MFTLCSPLAVFSFSVKLSSFVFASKTRIILHYSHLCTPAFFQENTNVNLTFAVCRKRASKSLYNDLTNPLPPPPPPANSDSYLRVSVILSVIFFHKLDLFVVVKWRNVWNFRSTDVREPRTVTWNRTFPFLARVCSSQRTGKTLVGRLWLDVTNVMASKRSIKENNGLPVAVRGSRNVCA